MKLARVFCFLMILGSSAVAAFGQTPVDPRLLVSDPPGCSSGVTYAGGPPLQEAFNNPQCFTYTGGSNLNELIFEFTGVPLGTTFICQTNIWVECGNIVSAPGTAEFDFSDPTPGVGGACQNNDGLFGNCPGFMIPGAFADVTLQPLISEIPEPGSIILFGTGLIGMIMAVKRRFHVQT